MRSRIYSFPWLMRRGESEPQSNERLPNRPYTILIHVGLYLTFTGGDGLYPVLIYKGVENGDRIPVKTSRGSGYTSRQSAAHLDQCPSAAEALLLEMISTMFSLCAWRGPKFPGQTLWVCCIHICKEVVVGGVIGAGGAVSNYVVYPVHKVVMGYVAVEPLL